LSAPDGGGEVMRSGTAITVIPAAQEGVQAVGGGLEGAKSTSRETALWRPSYLNPDGVINLVKMTADARGRDSIQNDGYMMGGASVHRDSIVGAQYRLNARPMWQVIPGGTEAWGEKFQEAAERLFGLAAESNDCWLDAAGVNTFTAMVRLAVVMFFATGEVTASAEWIRQRARPFKTAIQLFSPDRLCNPNGNPDNQYLRRGIAKDQFGKPIAYSVRNGDQWALWGNQDAYTWTTFAPRTPWGRKQMIHIIEQMMPDQSRGVADMVSVLKQVRMTKQFQEVVLQNAVINASYAAAIESELPDIAIQQAMGNPAHGSPSAGYNSLVAGYLGQLSKYLEGSNNLAIDGAKIPHLYPGTKLSMKPIGTPGGVGTGFEASLLRHIAAGIGVSYEELSKDYSQVSYSSARASAAHAEKFTNSRKKHVADRFADETYALWLEEALIAGLLPLPPRQRIDVFYQPYMKEAFTQCTWIGSGAGQIDELKETQAAILRVQSGLSTYEQEIAKLGGDYREVFAQAVREQKYIEKNNLQFLLSAKRPLGAAVPAASPAGEGQDGGENADGGEGGEGGDDGNGGEGGGDN
jgi:lambda family phage portal protein